MPRDSDLDAGGAVETGRLVTIQAESPSFLALPIRRSCLILTCVFLAFLAQEIILWGWPAFHLGKLVSPNPPSLPTNSDSNLRGFGLIGSIVIGILFGLLAPRRIAILPTTRDVTASRLDGSHAPPVGRLVSNLLVLASCLIGIAAQILFLKSGETPGTHALYLLSIAVFCSGMASIRRSGAPPSSPPPFTTAHWVGLGAIVLVALAARAWNLRDLPLSISPDVATVGLMAIENLSEQGWRLFGTGFLQSPNFATVPASLSMLLFGQDLVGLRLTDVFFGTSMVLFTYLVVWRGLDSHRMAVLASLVLTTSIPHIHFSRHVFNVDPWAVFTAASLFLVHGYRASSERSLGVAGLMMGFALEMYLSSRILVVLLPLFALYLLAFHSKLLWRLRRGALLFVLGILVSWGPNCIDSYREFATWERSNRLDSTILFKANYDSYAARVGAASAAQVVFHKVQESLAIFQANIDTSGQTNYKFPFVDHLAAPFIWLGLGLCIVNFRRDPFCAFMALAFFLAVFGHAAISSSDDSYWPRSMLALLVAGILISIGAEYFLSALGSLLRSAALLAGLPPVSASQVGRFSSVLCAVVATCIIGFRGWTDYGRQASADNNRVAILGRCAAQAKPGSRICGIPFDSLRLDQWEVRFFARNRDLRQIPPAPPHEAIARCDSEDAVWVVLSGQSELQTVLRERYPQGRSFACHGRPELPTISLFGTLGDPRGGLPAS